MSRPVTATHLFDFDPILAGWNKISISAGPSGDIAILALEQEPDYKDRSGTSPKLFVDKPNSFRVHHHLSDKSWCVIDIEETRQNMHYVQPLPQNQWILVRSRSSDNADGNGHVYSPQGELLKTIPLGDSIADVQTTEQGQIWLGYYDQGIFGDTLLGSAGLACLKQNGGLEFDFNAISEGMIADCYAFNVVNEDEVWLCSYTDFPIVKLKNNQISRMWTNNPIRGSHAFAVWKDRILFAGGYNEKNKLFIVNLFRTDKNELIKEECHATDENGDTIMFKSYIGKGSRLYLVTDESLYVLELQEI